MSLDDDSQRSRRVRGIESTERESNDRDPILEVRDTSVTFDMKRGESRVLDGVSLDIYRDEILGIVGESGSGKSMFASALLNAVVNPGQLRGQITYYPDENEPIDLLALDGRELKRLRWEEISMVFQGAMSSFNPTMTIRGHFEETLDAHNENIDTGMDHARELLRDLYLDPNRVLDRYPHELSGGMTQRALIALSLVLEPNVLVMDEPTAALDLLMQRSILTLLERLQEKYDLTVVFITHDLPLVAGLANRLAVMYAFEFAEIGPTNEILRNAAHPYTRSLLKAVPNLDASLNEMQPIEGSSPDPVNIPTGCSYHPRCPLAEEPCSEVPPEFDTVSDEHGAACHYWEDAAESIPYSLDATSNTTKHRETDPVDTTRSDSAAPVISIENASVHFDQNRGILDRLLGRSEHDAVHAVDNVSLDIHENDVVALVGESGCGKTTLGKTAIGIQRPTSGSLKYRGQDVWNAKDGEGEVEIPYDRIRRSLQIIHQDPGSSLNPNKKVIQSLSAPLKRWQSGMTREDRRARILGMLEHVGMTPAEDYADRYPHQLSGGEKQRIALVRALLMNPDVILADEAVSALDVSLRVEMMDLLLDLQEEFDTSFVFISHNLSNARYLAQNAGGRIGIMYLGELVEIGPAEEVLQNPRHPYTNILQWATAELDPDQAEADEPPVRTVDIPDPVNPPSGCRFHTRCPNAREACTRRKPELLHRSGDTETHVASCFRQYPDSQHEYWESDGLDGTSDVEHMLD